MVKALYHSLLFFLVISFFSCQNKRKKESAFALNAPEKNLYASYFKIYRQSNFSLLVTYLNVDKTDSAVYVLYGQEKPEIDFPACYVQTPSRKVACLSSVFVGYLDKLDVLNTVIAVDNGDFISNSFIQQQIEGNQVKQISKNGELNMEETLMSEVHIIFTNPSGNAKKDFDKRLLDIGIIPVVCADYYENHPLGRAEWVKAMALFFDRQNKADSIFNKVKENYLALKNSTDTCKYRPTVFTELKTNDVWYVAGGKSSLAQLLNDAGADYVWKDNDKIATTALNMEQVIQKALGADYWINLHLCNTANDLLNMDNRYGEFNAFKKRNLYNNNALLNKTGGNAYWESGLCNPDEILRDLVKIFHPNLQPDRQLKYYKQLK
ncbi:MAG TPA: ABC transporter substrate-binding protein [Bacteroidia bacterium]|jgi:iron complex transport system substrate-binding protein|nr:ABC transporter substrate-binding protein [Bacteroidia bacterium]